MPLVLTAQEDAVYPELPIATVLNGVITDIQERVADFGRGETQMVEFVVEINDPEIPEGTTVKGSASQIISPKSTLHKWITALRGGRAPEIGEEIDLNAFIGKNCQFTVKCKEKPNQAGVLVKYYNILDFMAMRPASNQTGTRTAGTTARSTASTTRPAATAGSRRF